MNAYRMEAVTRLYNYRSAMNAESPVDSRHRGGGLRIGEMEQQAVMRLQYVVSAVNADFDGDFQSPGQVLLDTRSLSSSMMLNPQTFTWQQVFAHFNQNKTVVAFQFRFQDESNFAVGDGVTRAVIHTIANQLVEQGVMKYFTDYHADFQDMKVCNTEEFAFGFAKLIHLAATTGALLPFHLPPELLQEFTPVEWNLTELFQESHSELWHSIKDLNEEELGICLGISNTDDDDCENEKVTLNQYIASMLRAEYVVERFEVFERITHHLKQLYDGSKLTVKELDARFSGSYEITPGMFLKVCNFAKTAPQTERIIWEKFIQTFTDSELRATLMLFSNSLSLRDGTISITTSKTQTQDVEIFTCMRSVKIRSEILQSETSLANLKLYLTESKDQKLSDGVIDNSRSDNNNNNDEFLPELNPDVISDFINDYTYRQWNYINITTSLAAAETHTRSS